MYNTRILWVFAKGHKLVFVYFLVSSLCVISYEPGVVVLVMACPPLRACLCVCVCVSEAPPPMYVLLVCFSGEGSQYSGNSDERNLAVMARAISVHQDTIKVMYFA